MDSSITKESLDLSKWDPSQKLKLVLKTMSVYERAYVRELTTNAANPWEAKLDKLTAIDKHLLTIGITILVGQDTIRFTSCILLRLCIDTLWPRPTDRLSIDYLSVLGRSPKKVWLTRWLTAC